MCRLTSNSGCKCMYIANVVLHCCCYCYDVVFNFVTSRVAQENQSEPHRPIKHDVLRERDAARRDETRRATTRDVAGDPVKGLISISPRPPRLLSLSSVTRCGGLGRRAAPAVWVIQSRFGCVDPAHFLGRRLPAPPRGAARACADALPARCQ